MFGAQSPGAGVTVDLNTAARGFRVELTQCLMGLPSSGVTIFSLVGFFRLLVVGVNGAGGGA